MYRKNIMGIGDCYCNVKEEVYIKYNRFSHLYTIYNGNFSVVDTIKDTRSIDKVVPELIKKYGYSNQNNVK